MDNDHPLVIIRFNQPRVYYDQQLYDAVSQAVSLKPSVTFDITSYAPATGDTATDAKWQYLSSTHTKAVVASMQQIGIPLSRMRVTGQHAQGIRYDEVHIVAR